MLDIGVGVDKDSYSNVSNASTIGEIYPNPIRNETDVRYEICDMGYEPKNTILRIYDATNRLLKDLSCSTPNALSPMPVV